MMHCFQVSEARGNEYVRMRKRRRLTIQGRQTSREVCSSLLDRLGGWCLRESGYQTRYMGCGSDGEMRARRGRRRG